MKRVTYIASLISLIISTTTSGQTDTSVTLRECTEAALKFNPQIKQAANELQIAGLSTKIVASGFYPSVSSSLSSGFSNELNKGTDYKTESFQISASQIIWQNGRNRSLTKQAEFASNASAFSLEAATNDIVQTVKINYYEFCLQRQLFNIAADNVGKARLFLSYANERYKVGAGRKTDVLKAESDLTQTESELNTYWNLADKLKNELIRLTGLPSQKFNNAENPGDFFRLKKFSNKADSLFEMAINIYPELQITKNMLLSQEAKIKATEAELYPRLNLTGGYNWNYNPSFQKKMWYTALSVQWSIFNGNQRRYSVQTEKIRKSVYENQKTEVEDFLLKELRNEILNIKNADNEISLTSSLIRTTTANLEIAQEEYKAGTASMLELTDARITDLTARKRYEQSITQFLISMANLERLTGDLSRNY